MKTICKMTHGSHLYGLNTESSDKDYKGIFLPCLRSLIIGDAPQEYNMSTGMDGIKNSSDDIDEVYFSLHKFIKMACDGDVIALDMLHCNDQNLIETSPIWKDIVDNKERFYTKNMKAFLGYAKSQAHKYGIKGSRLSAIKAVIDVLEQEVINNPDGKMGDDPSTESLLRAVADEHSRYVSVLDSFKKGNRTIDRKVVEICGSKYDFTTKLDYVLQGLRRKYNAYGHRAKLAESNEGIDFKAVSHAIRAGMQLKEIYETGDLKYPLKDRDFLLDVKQGRLDFISEVQPVLESVIHEVEELAAKSNFPSNVDRKYWDNFIVDVYKKYGDKL